MSALIMGADYVVEIPMERFDIDPYFDGTNAVWRSYVRHAA